MAPNIVGVLTIIIWSCMAVFLAYVADVPPFQIGAMTWFFAYLVLHAYFKYKGERMLQNFIRPLSDYLFVGMGVTLYLLLIYSAFHYAPPFEANVLNYTWPILLTLLMAIFQGVPLTILKIAGLILGFGGSFLLFGYRYSDHSFEDIGIGHVLALLAAIVWAVYSCFAKGRNYPTTFMAPVFLVSAIISLIGHLIFEETVIPDLATLAALLIIGLSRISYVTWDYAIRNGDREFITSLAYFIPLASTLFMIAFGFHSSGMPITIAGFMIIGGCLLVNGKQIYEFFLKRFK